MPTCTIIGFLYLFLSAKKCATELVRALTVCFSYSKNANTYLYVGMSHTYVIDNYILAKMICDKNARELMQLCMCHT